MSTGRHLAKLSSGASGRTSRDSNAYRCLPVMLESHARACHISSGASGRLALLAARGRGTLGEAAPVTTVGGHALAR